MTEAAVGAAAEDGRFHEVKTSSWYIETIAVGAASLLK